MDKSLDELVKVERGPRRARGGPAVRGGAPRGSTVRAPSSRDGPAARSALSRGRTGPLPPRVYNVTQSPLPYARPGTVPRVRGRGGPIRNVRPGEYRTPHPDTIPPEKIRVSIVNEHAKDPKKVKKNTEAKARKQANEIDDAKLAIIQSLSTEEIIRFKQLISSPGASAPLPIAQPSHTPTEITRTHVPATTTPVQPSTINSIFTSIRQSAI